MDLIARSSSRHLDLRLSPLPAPSIQSQIDLSSSQAGQKEKECVPGGVVALFSLPPSPSPDSFFLFCFGCMSSVIMWSSLSPLINCIWTGSCAPKSNVCMTIRAVDANNCVLTIDGKCHHTG